MEKFYHWGLLPHQSGPKYVTRQDKRLWTCGELPLVKKNQVGAAIQLGLFKALSLCYTVLFSWSDLWGPTCWRPHCTFLTHISLYFSFCGENVLFFMQQFSGWELPPVPGGGPGLPAALLGQSTAQAGWAEGGPPQTLRARVQQVWHRWVLEDFGVYFLFTIQNIRAFWCPH